ncbi:hypothetical protein NIES4106_45730 [Fischerella sp. NIES-4106]|jgi:hypothetical protein|nr:hypothetical protein NIES4106_45730 [Fischerella sp. NIES-4106]
MVYGKNVPRVPRVPLPQSLITVLCEKSLARLRVASPLENPQSPTPNTGINHAKTPEINRNILEYSYGG